MLSIYYGSEATDREKFIFEHVKGRTLLLVPDQFSLQAERDAFFYLGKNSLMDLRVVDFSTLGYKVMQQTGGRVPDLIDKYGRHMLLARVTAELESELGIYKGLNRKNSFIDMLNTVISEMKRYDVSPEDLEDVLGKLEESSYLSYKLGDILKVYRAYQAQIEGRYLDSEDYISFYGERILEAPMIHESEIWIYGFDTFTPKNMQVIERLILSARNVNIVMTYEAGKEQFELTGHVMGQLRQLAERSGIAVSFDEIHGTERKTVWSRIAQLKHGRRAIAHGTEMSAQPANEAEYGGFPITLVAASNMYAEAERAAAYILELVREEGYRYGDIVVVCNDTETRGGILRRTLMRWGIPVFMDKKRKVLHHQAVSFLLALLEVVAKGYRDEAVMSLVKSGMMPFSEEEKEQLENYVRQFRIRGSAWKNDFEKCGDRYDAEQLNVLNALRRNVVDCIENAKLRMGIRNTAGEKIRGLYTFLEQDMAVMERLEQIMERQQALGLAESAAETSQSWSVICNIFDQIVDIAGEERMSNEDLFELMSAGFEEVEIGLVPVTGDSVLIGTLQRTRLSQLKALLIVGANEGVLPLNRSDEGLLSEREKEILQSMELELSKRDEVTRQEEQLAIYRALWLPQERLYVSCCGVDEKGEECRPSEVFTVLREFVEKRHESASSEDVERRHSPSAFGDSSPEDERSGGTLPSEDAERRHSPSVFGDSSPEDQRSGETLTSEDAERRHSPSVFGDLGARGSFTELITAPKGTLSHMAAALRDYKADGMLDRSWLEVMDWYEKHDKEDFSRVKHGLMFDNRLEALGEKFADSLYKGDLSALEVSASRLEQYSRCPFSHFVMYGLKAQEPRIYEVGAREIGDVYHRCLMKLSQQLTPDRDSGMAVNDPDSPWMNVTKEECTERIRDIIRSDSKSYREGILSSGREESYRAERIAEICSSIAWSMIQQVRKGSIRSMRFEYPFGTGRALPPVRVDIGSQEVLIQGKIDRLDILEGVAGRDDEISHGDECGDDAGDRADGAYGEHHEDSVRRDPEAEASVRIIDYKTGSETVDPEYFMKGYKLQLMVYMKAAVDAYNGRLEPAGVFYFKIRDVDMDADSASLPADKTGLEKKLADSYRLEGILLNDDSLISSMDSEIDGSSQVIPVKISKKEGVYVPAAGGCLMTKEEFAELYEQVDMQVKRICTELCAGNIEIKPKRESRKDMEGNYRTACRYCRYRSICMFDTSFDGCRYENV